MTGSAVWLAQWGSGAAALVYLVWVFSTGRLVRKTPRLLTPAEAARLLGVGTTTVTRYARAGKLAHVRLPSGHRRYPEAAVLEFRGKHPLRRRL